MQIEKGYIYHIYNQGNNRRKIFFLRKNYLFFLEKIREYILPYGDLLAWCLMPNHFHLMISVNETFIWVSDEGIVLNKTHRMTQSHPMSSKKRTINNSIAILLRSYTRAINKQQGVTGSLFRPKTKAECLNCPSGITPSFVMEAGITKMNYKNIEEAYPQICFNYIHQNPVKARLVRKITDWEFSSARDYAGLRNGKLVSKDIATEYVVIG